MRANNSILRFVGHSRQARIVSLVLVLQAGLFYAMPKQEQVPLARPLSEFPARVNGWVMTQESEITEEVQEVLRADDTLSRTYASPAAGSGAMGLFVAYFRSQRTGVAPHSPKVCLPGSGWTPASSAVVEIPIPGRADPIPVNRYLVVKGEQKSLVLYWYQTHKRVIATEYAAKFYSALDSLRYRRSDAAIVRILAPVTTTEEAAEQTARQFAQDVFQPLSEYLPR